MAFFDAVFAETLNERDDLVHVVDRSFKIVEGLLFLEGTWQSLHVSLEGFDRVCHLLDLIVDGRPLEVFPAVILLVDFGVKAVEFVKPCDLFLHLDEFWIVRVRKTKQSLSVVVRLVLAVTNVVLFSEHLELVDGFFRLAGNFGIVGAILVEVLFEFNDISDEVADIFKKFFLEPGLFSVD